MPDGSEPAELMEAIGPWVQDCTRIIDGDGAYQHFKYKGNLDEQPAVAMEILDVVKSKWCELKNADMEKKYGSK